MPIEFNVNPYNDDFNADNGPRENNYMRILFKPGYAVQARELTQLQTAIQNQIKLFGDHIFQDGSPVLGGELTLDTSVISLKLEDQFGNTDVDVTEFDKQIITNNIGTVQNKKAKVIAIDDTQEYKTLMIRYVRGIEFQNGDEIKVVPGDSPKAKLIAVNSTNVGSVISINDGVFYVNGFFVNVPSQTITLDPYSRKPSYRVGLEIEETIIDDSVDTSLLDPAQESFNYQAPGADRYQFSLNLSKRALDSIDDSSFFELLRVENGVITKWIRYPVYSEIEKTWARRTADESGDYIIIPFSASASDISTDDSKIDVNLGPGKAYVNGFEFETVGPTTIKVNKARTTATVSDYDLSLDFGNYITVKNFYGANSGIFSTTNFANLDMHIVPTANINTSSSVSYNYTLAGTARAKSLQRNNGSKLDLYIIDQTMTTNTFNVAATSNATSFTFPSTYPINPVGLYNGVSFTVTAGTGSGQTRRIVDYNTSRLATVDREFDTNLDTSSQVTLNYAIKDVDSITVRPTTYRSNVYGGQNTQTAYYSSMDVDSLSQNDVGDTFIRGTSINRLLYPLPETYVSRNDFSNVDFVYRKLITNATFTSGSYTVTLTGKEKFFYGSNSSYLSDSTAEDNFIVIVRDKGSSSYQHGQLLSLSYDGGSNGIYRLGETQMRIDAGTLTFTGDVFVNIKIDNAEVSPAVVRQKTLKGRKSSITDVDYGNATLSVTGQTNTKIDQANGAVWFTSYSDINKIPGVRQSLYISDVVKINKVFDSGNTSHRPNSVNAIDITDHYLFDTGQRDNYYDHGSIILRDGKSPPSGQTVVLLSYFEHSGLDGFFSAASYSDGDFSNNYVGVYSSTSVPTTSLSDAIDFRPRRTDGTTASTFGGNLLPYTDDSMELSYGYYLPRVDKIVATSDKKFKILSGTPSKYPKSPNDVAGTMTLYTMFVPPYTKKASHVKFTTHEHRRYTMKDIARIDKRVQRLEYITRLSLLEQSATNETYFYEDGTTEKEKYGILVEQFDGFNIADNRNPDLICHISNSELKPYKKVTYIPLQLTSNSGDYKVKGKTYSLSYVEQEIISQNTATKVANVQPYLFGTFNSGQVQLSPSSDPQTSQTLAAQVTSTDSLANETVSSITNRGSTTTGDPQTTVNSSDTAQQTEQQATTQTQETLNQTGYTTTMFDNRQNDSSTVAAAVDASSVVNPYLLGIGSAIADGAAFSQYLAAYSGVAMFTAGYDPSYGSQAAEQEAPRANPARAGLGQSGAANNNDRYDLFTDIDLL